MSIWHLDILQPEKYPYPWNNPPFENDIVHIAATLQPSSFLLFTSSLGEQSTVVMPRCGVG
eukprot:3380127-Prorocentrum_lima.AAC.1